MPHPLRFIPAFALGLSLPLGVYLSHALGAWGYFLPFGIALAFIPGLDFLVSGFGNSPETVPSSSLAPHSSLFYSWLVWAYVPFQAALLFYAFQTLHRPGLSLLGLYGISLSTGFITGGVGVTVAHELIHRRRTWERGMGLSLLGMVLLMHYRIEHIFGHHKNVGTTGDPATARRGETLYTYYLRAIPGSVLHAWKLEAKRGWRRNRLLRYFLIEAGLVAAIGTFAGPQVLAFFLFQAWTAWLLLATIDYVEHYGLRRREVSPGRFEPVGPTHSWDSPNPVPNAFLFNLGFHSAHHLEPLKPYDALQLTLTAPRLPAGYPTLLLLAVFPPLWRKMMDSRLP